MRRSSPHGPFVLTSRRQVTVPKVLLDLLDLGPDDKVQFLFDHDRDEIVLIPDERAQRWANAAAGEPDGSHDE